MKERRKGDGGKEGDKVREGDGGRGGEGEAVSE